MFELKKYEEAILSYNQAIAIDPKNEYTLNNKGVVLYELKKYDEAILLYNRALELNPIFEIALTNKNLAIKRKNMISILSFGFISMMVYFAFSFLF